MNRKRWSIAPWLTRWFALTVGVAVLALSGLSLWFVGESVERELDGLVLEELHEMRADFDPRMTPAEFALVADKYDTEHPVNPLAWKVWHQETGELWGAFGSPKLLALAPANFEPLNQTTRPESNLRWRAEEVESDLVVGLLVDGEWQSALLNQLTWAVLGVGSLTALLALASGAILGRRLARHLHDVAAQVRAVQVPSAEHVLPVEGAPEEIREVADALYEMFGNIRRQQDRAQLMTAGLAHELRSPIQNLMSEAEVALLRNREVEEYREVLVSQVAELRDLGRVVDNLVMLCSPGEAGSLELERVDLEKEARLRIERNRSAADRAGVFIELETIGDLHLEGDREAILLALNNLVGNAVQWSPPGATVRVRISGEADAVQISVDDGGPGVPVAERKRIFEAFYRGPQSEEPEGQAGNGVSVGRRIGYGLGLALVLNAVQAHRGQVIVEDSPLGGARFVVRLPR